MLHFFLHQVSFDMSEYTAEVDAVGTLRILDAIRTCGMEKEIRFYQASTSELYGKVQETPQKETTPFYPRSPYGNPNKKMLSMYENFKNSKTNIILLCMHIFQHVQSCMVTGSLQTTGKLMECLRATEYYLIMRVPEEVKTL